MFPRLFSRLGISSDSHSTCSVPILRAIHGRMNLGCDAREGTGNTVSEGVRHGCRDPKNPSRAGATFRRRRSSR